MCKYLNGKIIILFMIKKIYTKNRGRIGIVNFELFEPNISLKKEVISHFTF